MKSIYYKIDNKPCLLKQKRNIEKIIIEYITYKLQPELIIK